MPDLIRHLILSWLLAVLIEYILLPGGLRDLTGLDGLAQMSLARIIWITCGTTLLLWGISCFANTVHVTRWGIVAVFATLAGASLQASMTPSFLVACLLICAGLIAFAICGWDHGLENHRPKDHPSKPAVVSAKSPTVYLWITAGVSAAFFLFVCSWTLGRVYSFHSPTYDFGIFSQMFYYMKESGLPMTTLERDGLLSHFAVHVSPIYYLLLPFYRLAPTPAALQVLQAAVITSAVVPLWKLGKHHGLSAAGRMLLCTILFLYPAYSGGTGYDIHENCFLTPLLLWLFYGIDRKNRAMTAATVILTLMVKEDAAVYVAVIALWLIVKTVLHPHTLDISDLLTGVTMLVVSLCWFFFTTGYLAESGDGVMTYRYENFQYDGSSSLITVLASVILNPMKVIYECADTEKLWFIAMTLLPLPGLLLPTRRYERYLLLIPYLLVNLMSDYPYQHHIFFQYTFGSTAFLFYLTILNLADCKMNRQRLFALVTATVVSTACFGMTVVPKAIYYPVRAIRYHDYYQDIRDALDTIPEDASVTATTFYTTWLSQRHTLYDVRYCSQEHLLQTQYVVLDLSAEGDYKKYAADGKGDGLESLVQLLEENGYTLYHSMEAVLVIYRKIP